MARIYAGGDRGGGAGGDAAGALRRGARGLVLPGAGAAGDFMPVCIGDFHAGDDRVCPGAVGAWWFTPARAAGENAPAWILFGKAAEAEADDGEDDKAPDAP